MVSAASRQFTRALGVSAPLLLAPMAGAADASLAIAVARAGGLGALAAATLSPVQIRDEVARFRAAIDAPINLNFFAHAPVVPDAAAIARWRDALRPLHARLGLTLPDAVSAGRQPFDAASADLVEQLRPEVVSFHFGLPDAGLLARVKATGARVLSSATTVAEARWLQAHGADAIVAQGWEAGGHRGMFLSADVDAQVGTFALVPQVCDAVDLPVIAAGGVADGRGVAAALMLGACAVQVGTAFLASDEALVSAAHRRALLSAADDGTRLTNVFTGRPARGMVNRLMRELGPMSAAALPFPYAGSLLAALRASGDQNESGDFVPLWAGQAASLAPARPAQDIAAALLRDAALRLGGAGPGPDVDGRS